MYRKLKLRNNGEFLTKPSPLLKMYKTADAIFRRLFPNVYAQ